MQSTERQRVIVTGATGTIGRPLCAALIERGYDVEVFSREPQAARERVPGASGYVKWEPVETGAWAKQIDSAYSVVYLAGGSILNGRQSKESVQAETRTRVRGIRGISHAIELAHIKPEVFLSASSISVYGFDGPNEVKPTEATAPGDDFWARDGRFWETPAHEAERQHVRTALLRIGYTLSADSDGDLAHQVAQFRQRPAGWVQPGSAWTSWIHIADVVGLILLALEDERISGPLNITAPGAVTNREFAETLGKVLNKAVRIPIPSLLLKARLGVVADTLTHGRQVVPQKALDFGYEFRFPTLEPALRDLVPRLTAEQTG